MICKTCNLVLDIVISSWRLCLDARITLDVFPSEASIIAQQHVTFTLYLARKGTSFKKSLVVPQPSKNPIIWTYPESLHSVHNLTSHISKAHFNTILKSALNFPWCFANKTSNALLLAHPSKCFLCCNHPNNIIRRILIVYEIFSIPSYFRSEYSCHIQLQEPHTAECGCDSQFHADVFLMLICWCVGILRSTKHWQINKVMLCLTECIWWYQ